MDDRCLTKAKRWLYILQEVPPSIKQPFSVYSLDLSLEWTVTKFSLDPSEVPPLELKCCSAFPF